jgi:8-oxo-dGTP pyrophosphatase MutT (NUDIX family)
VALVLREQKNGPEVLIIERAHVAGDPWSGHLAFPGGRRDAGDPSLQHTAVRETFEELGLDLTSHAEPLGDMDPVLAGSLLVAPFVFALSGHEPDGPALSPDPREVRRQFWVPLLPLLQGEHRTTFYVERDGAAQRVPGYQVADRVLWGMSYRMLQSLLEFMPLPGVAS